MRQKLQCCMAEAPCRQSPINQSVDQSNKETLTVTATIERIRRHDSDIKRTQYKTNNTRTHQPQTPPGFWSGLIVSSVAVQSRTPNWILLLLFLRHTSRRRWPVAISRSWLRSPGCAVDKKSNGTRADTRLSLLFLWMTHVFCFRCLTTFFPKVGTQANEKFFCCSIPFHF